MASPFSSNIRAKKAFFFKKLPTDLCLAVFHNRLVLGPLQDGDKFKESCIVVPVVAMQRLIQSLILAKEAYNNNVDQCLGYKTLYKRGKYKLCSMFQDFKMELRYKSMWSWRRINTLFCLKVFLEFYPRS